MIVFFRGYWCDHCRSQLLGLAGAQTGFQQYGVQIIAISSDDASGAALMTGVIHHAFPILVDNDACVIRHLDLVDRHEVRRVPIALPSVFLVDDSGTVRYHYVGAAREDRPRTELLLLAAEQMIARRK